jgi:hypothetical protein
VLNTAEQEKPRESLGRIKQDVANNRRHEERSKNIELPLTWKIESAKSYKHGKWKRSTCAHLLFRVASCLQTDFTTVQCLVDAETPLILESLDAQGMIMTPAKRAVISRIVKDAQPREQQPASGSFPVHVELRFFKLILPRFKCTARHHRNDDEHV